MNSHTNLSLDRVVTETDSMWDEFLQIIDLPDLPPTPEVTNPTSLSECKRKASSEPIDDDSTANGDSEILIVKFKNQRGGEYFLRRKSLANLLNDYYFYSEKYLVVFEHKKDASGNYKDLDLKLKDLYYRNEENHSIHIIPKSQLHLYQHTNKINKITDTSDEHDGFEIVDLTSEDSQHETQQARPIPLNQTFSRAPFAFFNGQNSSNVGMSEFPRSAPPSPKRQ